MRQYEGGDYDSILNEADKSRLIYLILSKMEMKDMPASKQEFGKTFQIVDDKESFLFFLKRNGLLVEETPLHSKARARQDLKIYKKALKNYLMPEDMIRDYYGDYVTMYFAWMNHFIKWLRYPGAISLIIGLLNNFLYPAGNSPLNGIFSIGMALWAVMFVIFFKRKCSEFNILWDNYNLQKKEEDVRKEFKGELMVNPVTGKIEPMFTSMQRLRRYIESFFICLPFFLVVLFVMACFLNLTAVVNPSTHGGLFYMEPLAKHCLPGQLLDPEGNIAAFVGIA
mmetsp:Transcript_47705/g.34956  ORF Transcript_47705/g.34956 Transcript_47705/m.34956 type:complete len:282 (-) Transcript_47705:210-1055(-)